MVTDFFDSMCARLFQALRREKSKCPDSEVLVAYHQADISRGEKRQLEEHFSLCSICCELIERLQQAEVPVHNPEASRHFGKSVSKWVMGEAEPADDGDACRCFRHEVSEWTPGEDEHVDDQTWYPAERRLDRKPTPWRTKLKTETTPRWRDRQFLVAAAAAVIALGGAVIWNSRDTSFTPSGPASLARGAAIQLHEPAGEVGALRVFTWSALPVADRFRLQVRQRERIVWEATVVEPRYRPSDEMLHLLVPQQYFEWRVQGLDADGKVVAESSWMGFERSLR